MVKAECEGGTSNLYGEIENVNYNNVTLQTNINSSDASPDNSTGDAQFYNAGNSFVVESGNPSYAWNAVITYNPSDYVQADYPIPSGYQGFKAFANITSNMNGTDQGTTLYMSAVGSSTQTNIINTPYGYTSQSANWALPHGTTAVNFGMEYTSANDDNGWLAYYAPQILIAPIGSTTFGGVFDSQYITMTEPQWPSSPTPTVGNPITVTGQVTYNGNPLANQTVTANTFGYTSSSGIALTDSNVINSSSQSVSQLTTTTDSNGDYSFTFTFPNSDPSGDYYEFDVFCNQSISGSQLTQLY